jgi:hypothetical protein
MMKKRYTDFGYIAESQDGDTRILVTEIKGITYYLVHGWDWQYGYMYLYTYKGERI